MLESLAALAVGVLLWSVATLEPEALAVCAATIAIAFALVTMHSEAGSGRKDEDDDAT